MLKGFFSRSGKQLSPLKIVYRHVRTPDVHLPVNVLPLKLLSLVPGQQTTDKSSAAAEAGALVMQSSYYWMLTDDALGRAVVPAGLQSILSHSSERTDDFQSLDAIPSSIRLAARVLNQRLLDEIGLPSATTLQNALRSSVEKSGGVHVLIDNVDLGLLTEDGEAMGLWGRGLFQAVSDLLHVPGLKITLALDENVLDRLGHGSPARGWQQEKFRSLMLFLKVE